jgi:hypothetical protein
MLFRNQTSSVLAISQITHAWLSGQLLRAWDAKLNESLLLAAEQHDIGWLDWETSPSFNPDTGRPHLFREIGAATHAPMWTRGVERSLAGWGAHVALLVSMHGGVIYRRYTDRHRISEADAAAAQEYLERQGPIETAWAKSLGLDTPTLDRERSLVAFVDTLSLALCGELKAPLALEALTRTGDKFEMQLSERPGRPFEFVLSPWPFTADDLVLEGEGRLLPSEGRFLNEVAMRAWLAQASRTTFRATLSRSC